MMYDNATVALEHGQLRFQGRPCVHGHSGVRYAKSGVCVECQRIAVKNNKNNRKAAYGRYRQSQSAESKEIDDVVTALLEGRATIIGPKP